MRINVIKTEEEFNREVSENTNVLRAIKLKCLDCSSYNTNEIKECPVNLCPLYPFRLGKNPFRKRELSDEERTKLSERMKNIKRRITYERYS